MFVRFFVRGCPAMAEILRCSVADCEESAAGSLEGRSFCREHFISTCYEQLDQCGSWQEERLSPDRTSDRCGNFSGSAIGKSPSSPATSRNSPAWSGPS